MARAAVLRHPSLIASESSKRQETEGARTSAARSRDAWRRVWRPDWPCRSIHLHTVFVPVAGDQARPEVTHRRLRRGPSARDKRSDAGRGDTGRSGEDRRRPFAPRLGAATDTGSAAVISTSWSGRVGTCRRSTRGWRATSFTKLVLTTRLPTSSHSSRRKRATSYNCDTVH